MHLFKLSRPALAAMSLISVIVGGGATGAAAAVAAPGIADAVYEAYLFDNTAIYSPQAFYEPGVHTGIAYGVETVTLGPAPAPKDVPLQAPLITAEVSGDNGAFDAFGRITYYGKVSGPDGGAPDIAVPLSVAYRTSGSGWQVGDAYDSFESAELQVGGACQDAACHLFFRADSSGIYGPRSFAEAGTLHIEVLPDQYFGVIMSAEARFDCHLCQEPGHSGAGQGFAMIDPVFTIDPAFLDANPGYTLSFSQGIGNSLYTSAAPEPATWALMILAVGGMGAALRTRRRKAVAAT